MRSYLIGLAFLGLMACGGSDVRDKQDGGGSLDDGGTGECELPGSSCVSAADCCSGLCIDDGSGTFSCGSGYGACQPLGQSCDVATDCCSLGCSGGVCDETICKVGGEDCTGDSDCCSNFCNASSQCEVPAGCFAAGEACDADSKCCSVNCVDMGEDGMRCGSSGSCRVVGEICSAAEDCCSFNCVIGDGEVFGTCEKLPSTNACNTVGEVCQEDAHCCSLFCRDDGAGFQSCQYLSGCRPAYELCREDNDCCNYAVQGEGVCDKVSPDAPVGRCLNPPGDAPGGEVCADLDGDPVGSNTCAGAQGQGLDNANCNPSGDGLPYRCDDGVDECLPAGESCSLGAQCCSGICAEDADGNLVCDPEDSCRADGESCTAHSDCCGGYCDSQTLTCGGGVD